MEGEHRSNKENDMANDRMSEVIQHLRTAILLRDGAGLTDGQLLEDYISRREEAALAALVRRHGPMVWGVCRRLLLNHHDAEDAFQATFLVLVRKAASVVPREMVANWLYGVAHQTALKARATTAKRRARERQVTQMPEPAVTEQDLWHDLQPLLDQELSRLPDKYRVAIVLCDLEEKTRKEAARQLGVPDGTLAARLVRGRVMLAKRLARHGLAVSGGSLATVLAQNAASAGVPTSVVSSTIKAASLFAAGQGAAAGVTSARVAALTKGVLKTMFLTRVTIATAVLLAVGALGTGAGWLTHQALAEKPTDKAAKGAGQQDRTEVRGMVSVVDASRNTIRVHLGKGFSKEETFALTGDAKVFLDDGTGDKLGFQEGKLADLAEGTFVALRLSADQKVTRIWADGPTIQGILKATDAAHHRIIVTVALTKGEPAADKTFPVARNARLFIDDGKVHDKSRPAKPPSLADLPAKAVVFLTLSADRKVVGSIRAEGHSVTGLLKAVDGAKNTITLTISTKGEPDVDRTFPAAKTVQVSIDGKPKDKAKPAEAPGVADLPLGAQVTLRLSVDGKSVVAIRAEGANVHGRVKAVDAAKDTLTLHDKVEGEKTYRVMKDAVVFLDGKGEVKKLADVPAGADVDLKLLADQKTVRDIRAQGPTVRGNVVGNAGTDSITLREKEGDKSYRVARDARILIDEKKTGKLTDLIDGTVAQLRLSADQATVLEVRAEGPSFQGPVKALDPDKNTITLTIGAKGGVGGEDKEFKLTKGTVVLTEMYGVPRKLTDLKVDREVVLRLSIDQKAAARITVLGE
jgi:RNA polymerase sigma factor (sigma-70 family)